MIVDRGMLSNENLAYLEQERFHYIVGARVRSLNKQTKQTIVDWAQGIREKMPEEAASVKMIDI